MLIADAEGLLFKSFSGKLPQTWLRQYLHRYDDYIECVHKSKQNLRVKAMFKKRHIDNHIEYLQVDTTFKSITSVHLGSYWGNNFRAREPMLRPMRLLLRHMPTLSHGMIPSKFPGEARFMPLLCPFLRAAKTIILFQVRSYGVKGVLELALGATLKPIIVYIVLLQTCSQPV